MITGAPEVASWYVTPQLPPARVQEPAEKTPVPLELDHVTVPEGEEPVTVAVQVLVAPAVTDVGEQDTEVEEECGVTVRLPPPELPRLLASPP